MSVNNSFLHEDKCPRCRAKVPCGHCLCDRCLKEIFNSKPQENKNVMVNAVAYNLDVVGGMECQIEPKKKVYEKPTIEKCEKMTFPMDIMAEFNGGRFCVQCSGCHGCR